MAPKAAAAAANPVRLDFPWALSTLVNPEDPLLVPQAFTYLLSLTPAQLPQDVEACVQLLVAIVPYMSYNGPDSQLSSSAVRLLGKLAHDTRAGMQQALYQPASLQALWDVLSDHHAVHPDYVVALAALAAEPSASEAPPSTQRAKGGKNAPPVPVDPESTLPGPNKYAIDAVVAALAVVAASGEAAARAAVGRLAARDVAPLLTLLKHNSCRIQVMALRLVRKLIRCEPFPAALAAAGGVAALTELLESSPYGAVREEVLGCLSYLMAAAAPALHHGLECGLLLQLLHHVLAPSTGVAHTPPPPQPPDAAPPPHEPDRDRDDETTGTGSGGTGTGAAAEQQAPPPLDFVRPVNSSAERLQELAVALLLQMARQHGGAGQALLRLGALQLLAGLLPAPDLPDLPPPPSSSRRPSSEDTIFAALIPGLAAARARAHEAQAAQAAEEAPPTPKDAWRAFLEAEPPLPLPPPAARASLSHRLQVSLLHLLACLLAEPGVQDYWWHVHARARPHLQLMYLLAAEEGEGAQPLQPVMSQAQMTHLSTPASRRTSRQGRSEPTQPPFPPEVRAAALGCLVQLAKHPSWLALAPYLAGLQATVRAPDAWGPETVAPLAEILQRVLAARRPPPSAAAAAAEPQAQPPPAADNGLSLEANGLAGEPLGSGEAVEALKALARMARRAADPEATSAVAAALMALPEGALYAPPWPPLPSPPPTPPPPPLPTSQYLWDALGRPVMTDGIQLVHL